MVSNIYRVEDHDGVGPYHSSHRTIEIQDMADVHNRSDNWPSPYDDPEIGDSVNFYEQCGFVSIQQLFNWFTPDDIRMLLRVKFSVVLYVAVPVQKCSKKQAVVNTVDLKNAIKKVVTWDELEKVQYDLQLI